MGAFSGPLGDLIPLAIANVIQIPLFVLNPSFLTPFVMISPEGMVPASNVVYLAYNASGPGHYDALIISQRDQQERFTSETNSNLDALESQSTLSTEKVPISTPRKPCRCGEKNKYKSKAKASRNYKGRCKCINEHGTLVWGHV